MSMGKKVVCVEKEATSLLVRKFVLERGGFEVLTAMDLHSALRLIEDAPPDLLVIDESTARSAIGHLPKVKRQTGVPVLLLTDMQWPEEQLRATADGYFWRAEPAVKLLDKVNEMLGN